MMYMVHHQDTILVVSPYPYCIEEDRLDVPRFPWKTVGMHDPSSSSHAFCVPRVAECRYETTRQAQMTSCSA